MVSFGLARFLNLIFQIGDLFIDLAQLSRSFAFEFRRIGPGRETIELNVAPAMKERVVFLENQSQNFARLPRCWSPRVGQVETIGQLAGRDVHSELAVNE